ncbi:Rap1a/Tai family immunity protein [Roseovarius sp.]|uniref:Rap1a/Tai family immunity protein n=1 Tax=Roseovarius sp. TaxID=1486281 RepID=UPI0026348353|nr:Rap1a/Tai family immunity protein [Roseovarius sp.]
MIRLFRTSLLCGLLGFATTSFAQQVSGNELLETCTSDNQVLAGFCIGYVIGYSEGAPWGVALAIASARGEMAGPDVNNLVGNVTGSCVPSDAANGQLKDVVTKYLQENPDSRHESARTLIWRAYAAAFPCG